MNDIKQTIEKQRKLISRIATLTAIIVSTWRIACIIVISILFIILCGFACICFYQAYAQPMNAGQHIVSTAIYVIVTVGLLFETRDVMHDAHTKSKDEVNNT